MTCADIVHEIRALPPQEQFEVLESLARLLRLPSQARPQTRASEPNLVAAAAAALRADYQTDPDLTAFTALDSEDFHAAR